MRHTIVTKALPAQTEYWPKMNGLINNQMGETAIGRK